MIIIMYEFYSMPATSLKNIGAVPQNKTKFS